MSIAQGLYYATVAVYGGGAIDTGYITVVLNKDMPVYVPGGLNARNFGADYVELKWDDRSSNETGFSIERADSTGVFHEIARVDSNVRTFNDSTIIAGTYEYRLRAFAGSDYSGYSLPVSVDVPIIPTVIFHKPMGGEVYNPGDTLYVRWTTVQITFIQVLYSTDGGENWTEISQSGGISDNNPYWENFPWVVPDIDADSVTLRVQEYMVWEFGATSEAFSVKPAVGSVQPWQTLMDGRNAPSVSVGSGGQVRVGWDQSIARVEIMDMAGRVVRSFATDSRAGMQVSPWAHPGVFIVRFVPARSAARATVRTFSVPR